MVEPTVRTQKKPAWHITKRSWSSINCGPIWNVLDFKNKPSIHAYYWPHVQITKGPLATAIFLIFKWAFPQTPWMPLEECTGLIAWKWWCRRMCPARGRTRCMHACVLRKTAGANEFNIHTYKSKCEAFGREGGAFEGHRRRCSTSGLYSFSFFLCACSHACRASCPRIHAAVVLCMHNTSIHHPVASYNLCIVSIDRYEDNIEIRNKKKFAYVSIRYSCDNIEMCSFLVISWVYCEKSWSDIWWKYYHDKLKIWQIFDTTVSNYWQESNTNQELLIQTRLVRRVIK